MKENNNTSTEDVKKNKKASKSNANKNKNNGYFNPYYNQFSVSENATLFNLAVEQKVKEMLRNSPYFPLYPRQDYIVPIEESVHDDYLICLEDGKKVKLLESYLRRQYNMTFLQYKKKWSLPYNYPSLPVNFQNLRRKIAYQYELGKRNNDSDSPLKTKDETKVKNTKIINTNFNGNSIYTG